jgi:hypothetical protein
MEILLQKANIQDSKIKPYITRVVAHNLSALSEPCHYPNVKQHYHELLRFCDLTEEDIKEFTKRRWKGRKEYKFLTHMEQLSNFYIFLMQYFLKKKEILTYRYLMIFYTIRQYANLMHLHLKYCVPETFKYALDNLTKNHLFIREKTIGNAVYYLAQESIRRWTKALEINNLDGIAVFMVESRSRVNQSLWSFLREYRKVSEGSQGIKTAKDPSEDEENSYQYEEEKTLKFIDDIVKKICVYKSVDIRSQEEARTLSKLNSSLATLITSKLGSTKYLDNIRIILKLFIKEVRTIDQLCSKEYETVVRKLMSVKRTKQRMYFKQQVNILLIELLKDARYKNKYDAFTFQNQFLVNLFLAYYITLHLKTSMC